jgi:hypothetical protein
MRRKPWPIILLAFLYLIFPLLNILVTYIPYRHEVGFIEFLDNLFFNPYNRLALFNMFVPSLLAAYAVYKVRKWSFAVVLICILWLAVSTIREYSSDLGLWTILMGFVIPIIINITLASYILIPDVYAVYRDSMIRWWERESRFIYKTPVEIHYEGNSVAGELINLSSGGCFMGSSVEIPVEFQLLLKMNVLNIPLELKAKTGHRRASEQGFGYGLQFFEVTDEDKKKLKTIVQQLDSLKYPLANPLPDWKEDFKLWFKELITTGKGITPKLPDNHKK